MTEIVRADTEAVSMVDVSVFHHSRVAAGISKSPPALNT